MIAHLTVWVHTLVRLYRTNCKSDRSPGEVALDPSEAAVPGVAMVELNQERHWCGFRDSNARLQTLQPFNSPLPSRPVPCVQLTQLFTPL